MEELYQICDKYFCLLLENLDKLPTAMQINIVRDKKYVKNTLSEIHLRLFNGNFDLCSLINFCKIGDILNMDILSEVLINIKYSDYFKSAFNENDSDYLMVLNYYNRQNQSIIELIKKVLIINIVFDNLVFLIRREYDKDFFRIGQYENFYACINDESYFNYIKRLRYVALNLLNNECFCDNNLDNGKKIINTLKTRRMSKEDLLSDLVDNSNFNELVIKEWQVFREHLMIIKCVIKRLSDVNKNFKLMLFYDFINEIDLYIEKRIDKLYPRKLDKIIVKRFNCE